MKIYREKGKRKREKYCFGRDERIAIKKNTLKENHTLIGGWRENEVAKRCKRYEGKVLDAPETVAGG